VQLWQVPSWGVTIKRFCRPVVFASFGYIIWPWLNLFLLFLRRYAIESCQSQVQKKTRRASNKKNVETSHCLFWNLAFFEFSNDIPLDLTDIVPWIFRWLENHNLYVLIGSYWKKQCLFETWLSKSHAIESPPTSCLAIWAHLFWDQPISYCWCIMIYLNKSHHIPLFDCTTSACVLYCLLDYVKLYPPKETLVYHYPLVIKQGLLDSPSLLTL
jgi:hypothetical protein